MTRQCSRCGGRVPAGVSFFCHRCGARLECEETKEYPVCPRCGRSQSDRNSTFCDRCGVQLVPPSRLVAPDSRMQPIKTCPACGHPNPGDSISYCKQCGRPLKGEMPHRQWNHGEGGDYGPDIPGTGGMAGRETARKKKQEQSARPLSLFRGRISWKVATVMAVVFLVIIVVFFIVTGGSGNTTNAGSNSSSNAGTTLPLSFGNILGAGPENSSAAGNTTTPPAERTPARTKTTVPVPVSNRAAAVVTDKPLKMK